MVQHIYRLIIFLSFFTIIQSCKKESVEEKKKIAEKAIEDDSIIQTLETGFDGKVVRINGRVLSKKDITEYGFILSSDTVVRDSIYYRTFTVNRSSSEGVFYKDIISRLETGKTYYYKAYIKKNDSLYVGKTKKFVNQFTLPIIITKIIENDSHLGDTLSVLGRYFDTDYSNVYFNDLKFQRVSSSDSIIRFVLPGSLQSKDYKIFIKESGTIYKSNEYNHTLSTPKIISVPSIIDVGDTIVITGNHFDNDVSRMKLTFGNYSAKIISADRNKLSAIFPATTATNINLKLFAQLQTVEYNNTIAYGTPSFSHPGTLTVSIDDTVRIPSKNLGLLFSQTMYLNEDYLHNYVIEGQYLKFVVPDAPYPERKFFFSISTGNQKLKSDLFQVKSDWVWINNCPFLPQYQTSTFKFNNEQFVISSDNNQYNYKTYLYAFNDQNFTWKKYDTRIQNLITGQSTTKGIFLVDDRFNVHLFNLKTNISEKKASIPFGQGGYILFGDDENLFAAEGLFIYADNSHKMNLYKYKYETDEWITIHDFPGRTFGQNPKSFNINNRIYVLTYLGELWEYISSSDFWIHRSDLPNRIPGGPSVSSSNTWVHNDKAYCIIQSPLNSGIPNYVEYDPNLNSWTNKGIITTKNVVGLFGFSINNKMYASFQDVNKNILYQSKF